MPPVVDTAGTLDVCEKKKRNKSKVGNLGLVGTPQVIIIVVIVGERQPLLYARPSLKRGGEMEIDK